MSGRSRHCSGSMAAVHSGGAGEGHRSWRLSGHGCRAARRVVARSNRCNLDRGVRFNLQIEEVSGVALLGEVQFFTTQSVPGSAYS